MNPRLRRPMPTTSGNDSERVIAGGDVLLGTDSVGER
jgi:hypothetical protein